MMAGRYAAERPEQAIRSASPRITEPRLTCVQPPAVVFPAPGRYEWCSVVTAS